MLASFCLPPMGSSRGQGMLLSEACSCSAERRKRRPIIEIVKLPAVSRIRVRWRPPVSVPYTSLSTGLRLDTFGMKLRLRRWSGASATRRSKAAVHGWTSRCAKRPSWYQSDEACRSVIENETAGTWVFCKSDGSRLYGPPDTRTQLSTTAWSATDLSACPLRGPMQNPLSTSKVAPCRCF